MANQDFIDQYRELLIIQYSDKPKAVAEIELLMATWSNVYDFFNAFFTEFDLDQAYGDRLDKIGKIVGVGRTVIFSSIIEKEYFGFSGVLNAKTFSEGPFLDIVKDVIYTETQLNDDQFRFYIRSKIAKNITSAYMANDERQSLQDTIQFLFKNRAFIVDNKDMSLSIYIDESFPASDLQLLLELGLIPTPQGVGIKFIVSYTIDETFGFSENPNSKTFGQGKFATVII